MRTQLITLSIMLVMLVLLVPFPEFDSFQKTYSVGSMNAPDVIVQSIAALMQSTTSADPQEETRSSEEPLILAGASVAEQDPVTMAPAGSRDIREAGLEEYQMNILSADIQETQISYSDQNCLTSKSCSYTTSIHGNTMSTGYGFDFYNLIQKRYPVAQRSNIKYFPNKHQIPHSDSDNRYITGDDPNNPPDIPPFQQQIDNETFRESGQMLHRIPQRQSTPSVRPVRRAAVSLPSDSMLRNSSR